eukprot:g37039.t1
MGETLNKYFASMFTVDKDMEDREYGEINSNILKNVNITEDEVLDILKCIKKDKSLGPDQVYPRILWEAREEIAEPYAEIFVSLIATEAMKRIDEGTAVDVIYMVFSQAFDKIPHGRLVSK